MNGERRISSSTPTVQLPDGDDAEDLPSSLPSSHPPSAKPSKPSALLAELLPIIGSNKSINSPRSSITSDSSAFDDHWPASLDTRRPSANTITMPKLSESQEVVEETNENQKAPAAPSAIDKLIEPLTASKQQKLQQKQAADDSQTRPGNKAKDLANSKKEIFYEEDEKKLTLFDKPDKARTDNSTDGGKKSPPGGGEEKASAEKETTSRAKGVIMNRNAENMADTSPIMGGTGVNQSLPNLQSTIVSHPKVASLPATNQVAGTTHSKPGYSSAASIPGSISPSIARGFGGIPTQRAPNDSTTASRVLNSTPATPHSVSKSRSQQKSAIPEESVPAQPPMATSTPVKSAPDSDKSAPRAGHTMREFFNECGPDDLANEVKTAIQTLETVSAKVPTTNPGGGAVSQPSQRNDMVLGYIDWLLDRAKVYHEQATGKTYTNDQCEGSKLGNGWKMEDLPPEKVGNYIQDMVQDAVSFSSDCSNQQHTRSRHSSPHDRSMRLRYTLRRPCCNRGGDPCSEAMTSSMSASLSSAEQSELSDLALVHPGCQVPAAVARGCENVSTSTGISKTQEIKSCYETCSSASSMTECTSKAFETCSTKSTFADCPQISLQENMNFDDFANTFSENCPSMSWAESENFKCDTQENFSASQSHQTHGYPSHFLKLAQRPLVNICECKPPCSNTESAQQNVVSALKSKVNSPSMGINFYKSSNDLSCSTLTSECSSDGNSSARNAEEKSMGIIQQTLPNHSVNEPICERQSKEQQPPHDYWYEPAPSSTLPTRSNQATPPTGSTARQPVVQTHSSSTCVPVSSDECLPSKTFEDFNVDRVQRTANLSKECNPDPIAFGTDYNSEGFGATRKPSPCSSPFTPQPPNNQMLQMEKGNKNDIHVISGTSSSSTSTTTPLPPDICLTSTANQSAFGDSQLNQQTVEPYILGATNLQKDSSTLVPCETNVEPISPEHENKIPSTSTSGNSLRSNCSVQSPVTSDGCISSDEPNVDCPPATIENDVAKSTLERKELGTPFAEAKFGAANTSMPCSTHQPVKHPIFQGLSRHQDQTSRPEIDYSRTCSTCTPVSSDGCLSWNAFAEADVPSIEKRATKSAPEQREQSIGGFGTTSMPVTMDSQPNQLQQRRNNDNSACNTPIAVPCHGGCLTFGTSEDPKVNREQSSDTNSRCSSTYSTCSLMSTDVTGEQNMSFKPYVMDQACNQKTAVNYVTSPIQKECIQKAEVADGFGKANRLADFSSVPRRTANDQLFQRKDLPNISSSPEVRFSATGKDYGGTCSTLTTVSTDGWIPSDISEEQSFGFGPIKIQKSNDQPTLGCRSPNRPNTANYSTVPKQNLTKAFDKVGAATTTKPTSLCFSQHPVNNQPFQLNGGKDASPVVGTSLSRTCFTCTPGPSVDCLSGEFESNMNTQQYPTAAYEPRNTSPTFTQRTHPFQQASGLSSLNTGYNPPSTSCDYWSSHRQAHENRNIMMVKPAEADSSVCSTCSTCGSNQSYDCPSNTASVELSSNVGPYPTYGRATNQPTINQRGVENCPPKAHFGQDQDVEGPSVTHPSKTLPEIFLPQTKDSFSPTSPTHVIKTVKDSTTFNRAFLSNKHSHPYNRHVNSTNNIKTSTGKSPRRQETFDESFCSTCTPIPPVLEHSVLNGTRGRIADVTPKRTEYHNSFTKAASSKSPAKCSTTNNHCPSSFAKYLPTANSSVPGAYGQTTSVVQQSSGGSLSTCPHEEAFRLSNSGCINPSISNFPPHMKATATLQKQSDSSLCSTSTSNHSRVYSSTKRCFESMNSESREFHSFSAGNASWDGGEVANFPFDRPIFCGNISHKSNFRNFALHDSSSDSSVLTVQLTSNPTASKYQTDVYEQSSLYTKSSFTSFSSFESSRKFGMPPQHHRVAELKKRESFQFVFGEPYSRSIEVGSPYITFQAPSCNTNCNADSTQAQPKNQPKFSIHNSSNVHTPINLQSHNVYCESRMSSKTEIMCTTPNPVSCLSNFFPPGEKPAFLETKAVYVSVSNKFQPKNQTDAVNCNDDDAKSDVSDMKTASCSFNPEEYATKLDEKPTVEGKYEPDTKAKKTGSGIHVHVSIHNNLKLPCSSHPPADCVQCKTNIQVDNKEASPETKTGSPCCNFGASYAELAHELNKTTKELLDFIRAEWSAQTAQQPPKSGENYLSDKIFQQPFQPQAMSDECYGHFAEHTKQFTRHVSTACDSLSENMEPTTNRLPDSAKIVHQKVNVVRHPPCHLSQAKQIDVTHLPEHSSNSFGETFVSSQEGSSCYDVQVVPNGLPGYFDIASKDMCKERDDLRSRSPTNNIHPTIEPLPQIYTNSGQSSCLPPQPANCPSLTANCSSSSYTTSSIDSPVYPVKNIAQKDKTCEPPASSLATSGKEMQEQRFVFQPCMTLTGTSYQPSIRQEPRQMSPSFRQKQKDAIQPQEYDCNTSGETSLTTDSSREFPFLSEVFVKSSIPIKATSCEQQISAVVPSNQNNVVKNPDLPLDPYASDTPVLRQMSECDQEPFPIPLSFGGMPSNSAAYDYNSDAGISSTSATHGDPPRGYHNDSNETASSSSPCQRSDSTHAPSPSFPPNSGETNKITSSTPNCHDYTNGILTDSTSDHKDSSGDLHPDSAISTKANTLPYETQDKSPPCVKTSGASTANGPDVTVKVTSFNCDAAYAGVPVHGNDPFLPLHSVLVKVRSKATDTSVVTRVLYPHSNFPSSIIKGPYYNNKLSNSDPVTDVSTTHAEAQSAGDTTPSSDSPLATHDQPSSIEFDESRANGDYVSIKRADSGITYHQQHSQDSECPQQGLSIKLHVGCDRSDVQSKENRFIQPNTPLGNQAFQPLPSTEPIPGMNLPAAVAEEGQSNDRVKDASSKEADSKAPLCTTASSSNSSSINLLKFIDSSSSSENSEPDVADGERIDTQPNVLSPSIEKLPPSGQHEACPPSDINADKMPDSHPRMSIEPSASHDHALDSNDSKQPSNISTNVYGSANKAIRVTHPSFESHNSMADQNTLLAINKPPSRRFSISGQCLVRRCSHSRPGYFIPTEGSGIIPPCNTAASSWSRSSAESTGIPPHLAELPYFEASTPATYSAKSENLRPNSQFVRYFKNGTRQPPTTHERRASESGVDMARTISPESSSKPVGMTRRSFQRPTSPPAKLTRKISEAVETVEKTTFVNDNILSAESPEYKIWSHILSGPKANEESKHIASTTLKDVPPIDGTQSFASHSSTDSPSVYKTCSGGTTSSSKSSSEDATPLVKPLSEDATQLVKPLSEDATPLDKPLSEDATPLVKPLREDAMPLVKPLSEDTTPLAKPLSEDTTPLAKPLSEDTTPLTKPLSEDTTPLAKPLSEDTTSLAKPLSEDTTLLVKPLSEDTTSLAKPLNRNASPLAKPLTEERASFSQAISEDTPPLTKPWSEDTPPHDSQSNVSMSLIDGPGSEDGNASNSFGLPTVTEQFDESEEPVEQNQPISGELGANSFITVESQASPQPSSEPFGPQASPMNCQRPSVPSGPKKRRRRSISNSISPHSIVWSLLQTEQKEIYLEGKPLSESLKFLRKCLPLTADMTPLDRFVYIYVYNKRYTEMMKERLQEEGVCAYMSHLLVEPFMMDDKESTELMDPSQHDEQCLAEWQSHLSEDAKYFYS